MHCSGGLFIKAARYRACARGAPLQFLDSSF